MQRNQQADDFSNHFFSCVFKVFKRFSVWLKFTDTVFFKCFEPPHISLYFTLYFRKWEVGAGIY